MSKFVTTPGGKPGIPGNVVADYINGSLATFIKILHARRLKQQKIVIDSSMTENIMYYSQPVLFSQSNEMC